MLNDTIAFNNSNDDLVVLKYDKSVYTAAEIMAKDYPSVTNYWEAVDNDFPTDIYFKNAWYYDDTSNKVEVDIPKAKVIHLNKLKKMRDEKWSEMGVVKNPNSALDSQFTATEQTLLTNLRTIEAYDLSSHSTVAAVKADIPSFLT